MQRHALPLGGHGWTTSRGQLALWTPAPAVLVAVIAGHGEAMFAEHILKAYAGLPSDRSVSLFFDTENLESYHSDLRIRLTERLARDRGRLALSVLVRSKLVAMGVSVANLALRGAVVSHSNRSSFVTSLEAALAELKASGFSSNVLLSAQGQLKNFSLTEP